MKYFKFVLGIALVFFLNSCIGIKVDTEVNKDGSGKTSMVIKISQMFFQMDQGDEATDVPVPLSKEEFEQTYEGMDGVEVVNVEEEDTEENKIISSVVKFDDVSSLAGNDMFEGAELSRSGGKTQFEIVLKEAVSGEEAPVEEEMDDGTREMIATFYEGYLFEYTFTAPGKIREYSLGELSGNGRTVTYKVPMYDFSFMEIDEPLVFRVVW